LIVLEIESNGNPRAYNKRTEARGLYQITPICLRHYNDVHRSSFTGEDLFQPLINKRIAVWYIHWLEKRCSSDREVLISYNYGFKHRKDKVLTLETRNYLLKYQKIERARASTTDALQP
jgi:soluble lytic murein transglycosylase-like protein